MCPIIDLAAMPIPCRLTEIGAGSRTKEPDERTLLLNPILGAIREQHVEDEERRRAARQIITELRRRVQHYGFQYDYRGTSRPVPAAPFPPSRPGTPDGPCDTAPRCESSRPPHHRKGLTHWQSFAPPRQDHPAATVV